MRPKGAKVSEVHPKRGTKEPKMSPIRDSVQHLPKDTQEDPRIDQTGVKGSPKAVQDVNVEDQHLFLNAFQFLLFCYSKHEHWDLLCLALRASCLFILVVF